MVFVDEEIAKPNSRAGLEVLQKIVTVIDVNSVWALKQIQDIADRTRMSPT